MAAPICQRLNNKLLGNLLKFSFARQTADRQIACNIRLCMQRLNVSTVVPGRVAGLDQQILQRLQPCRLYSSETTEIQEQNREIPEKDRVVDDVDALYQRVLVEVKGHDFQVMQSYRKFVYQTAKELDVNLVSCKIPKKHIDRRSLLRSVFIYKKHWTQYEMRTHFMIFMFKHLTGSTADTLLEYIQRNLPEGMAMKVTKHRIEKFPEHLQTLKAEQQYSAQ